MERAENFGVIAENIEQISVSAPSRSDRRTFRAIWLKSLARNEERAIWHGPNRVVTL